MINMWIIEYILTYLNLTHLVPREIPVSTQHPVLLNTYLCPHFKNRSQQMHFIITIQHTIILLFDILSHCVRFYHIWNSTALVLHFLWRTLKIIAFPQYYMRSSSFTFCVQFTQIEPIPLWCTFRIITISNRSQSSLTLSTNKVS